MSISFGEKYGISRYVLYAKKSYCTWPASCNGGGVLLPHTGSSNIMTINYETIKNDAKTR